jgi:hypothetical protein
MLGVTASEAVEVGLFGVVVIYLIGFSCVLLWRGRRGAALYHVIALLLLVAPYLVFRLGPVDWARYLMLPGVIMLMVPIFLARRRTPSTGEDTKSPGGAAPRDRQDV